MLSPVLILILTGAYHVQSQHRHHRNVTQSLPTEWQPPMEIDVRSMHRYCQGKCFYLPEECKSTLTDLNCTSIASITRYKPQCANPEKSATEDLCIREGHLFVVTLMTQVRYDIVKSKDLENYKKFGNGTLKCSADPFIAIAFTDDIHEEVVPTDLENGVIGDVFYTCVAHSPYVTSWVKPVVMQPSVNSTSCVNDGTEREYAQLMGTNPYPPMGASTLWSKIKTRYDQYAIGCKFIISDLDQDLTVSLTSRSIILPIFQKKRIKIATGIAYLKNGMLEDVFFSAKSSKLKAMYEKSEEEKLMDDASIVSINGIPDWSIPEMNIKSLPPRPFLENQRSLIAGQEISKVYDLCLKKKAMCFIRNDEQYCILKRNCHFLTVVESRSRNFEILRFYMIFQPRQRKGVLAKIHPEGWAAIGFSNDTKMGRDFVFTCVFRGTFQETRRGYNTDQMFFLPDESEDFVTGNDSFVNIKSYVDMNTETSMCLFDTYTKDILLKAFYYSNKTAAARDKGTWAELFWSLTTHEYFVLLAQGTTMYHDKRLSYHTSRSVSYQKFSKELYFQYIGNSSSAVQTGNILVLAVFFAKVVIVTGFKYK